jgi:hypothetical protein
MGDSFAQFLQTARVHAAVYGHNLPAGRPGPRANWSSRPVPSARASGPTAAMSCPPTMLSWRPDINGCLFRQAAGQFLAANTELRRMQGHAGSGTPADSPLDAGFGFHRNTIALISRPLRPARRPR